MMPSGLLAQAPDHRGLAGHEGPLLRHPFRSVVKRRKPEALPVVSGITDIFYMKRKGQELV